MPRGQQNNFPVTSMTIAKSIIAYFCLLILIAWALWYSKSFSNSSSDTELATYEKLLPIIQQVQAAEKSHAAGHSAAAHESLKTAFTNFQIQCGETIQSEAIQILSSYLLGYEQENVAAATNPSPSTYEKSSQLGHLWYTAAKEVFGPTHFYSLSILQSLAVRMFNQGYLDKSFELHADLIHKVQEQMLRVSVSKSNEVKVNTRDKQFQRFAGLLIRALDNVKMLHVTRHEWKSALEMSKEIYKLYNLFFDPASAETIETLEKVVRLYRTVLTQDVTDQQQVLFQQVTEHFHRPRLTSEDTRKIVEAYETADQMTRAVPSLALEQYLTLLTSMNQEEEHVYEIFFVIVRLLRSSARLRDRDPEYENYRKTLMDLTGRDEKRSGLPHSFVEDMDRSSAQAQQVDAVERAQGLVKRDQKVQGAAKIIQMLYNQVGMTTKEAEEIRKLGRHKDGRKETTRIEF